MRRLNSKIKVDFISEKGFDTTDKTYFAYVPLENMICYVVAESCDSYSNENSAELAVKSVLSAFERNPSFRNLKKYIRKAHQTLRDKRLEASITVVVSDYTKFKYASCGNVKFYLLNNDVVEVENKTHNYVYESLNPVKYQHDKEPMHDRRNLSQYLGQKKSIRPFVSKRIEIPEGCTMLFATVNIWEALDNVEILDAYKNSDNFVDCIQALYIPAEREASVIGSYTIASLFAEKIFKEDKKKKKKRRLIIGITIIVALVCAIVYYLDRRAITIIRNLDNRGIEYLERGRHGMVFVQYDEAHTRTDSLRLRWLHRREKNALTETIPLIRELFYNLVAGDEAFESGNHENAYNFYRRAEEINFNLSEVADYSPKYAPKILTMLDIVEEYISIRLEKIEEYVEIIKIIRATNDMILAGNYLDALAKSQNAIEELVNIGSLENRDTLMARINNEQQRISLWVESKGLRATEKIVAGDFDGAINVYEEMMQLYIELGEISRAVEMQGNINDVNATRTALQEGIAVDAAEEYIRNGDNFFLADNFDYAIMQYHLARNIYVQLGMNDEIRRVDGRISEAQARRVEAELIESILATQILETAEELILNSVNQVQANDQLEEVLDLLASLNNRINNLNDTDTTESVDTAEEAEENETADFAAEGRYFEQLGDNFAREGDFANAIEHYNMVWESYLRAEEIETAFIALLELLDVELAAINEGTEIQEESLQIEENANVQ